MPLLKQNISIPFVNGINTKSDDKQNAIGSIAVLQNAILETPNKIRKRNGYTSLSTKLLNNTNLQQVKRLASFNDELDILTSEKLYAFSNNLEKWIEKGEIEGAFPTSTTILRNTYQQSSLDGIHLDGINVFAWEDSRGGVRISVMDSQDGNFLLSDTEVSSSGSNPRIGFIFNNAYIFYVDGTDIKYKIVNTFNPSEISTEQTFVSDLNATNKVYDILSIDDVLVIGYPKTSGDLTIQKLNADGTTSSAVSIVGETPTTCVDLTTDSNSRIVATYYDGTDVSTLIYSLNLSALILSATTIETVANVENVTTVYNSSNDNYAVYYEVSASNTYDHLVRRNTVTLAGSAGTPSVLSRSVGLASKAFQYGTKDYVTVVHDSPLQDSYFILNNDGKLISRIAPAVGGGIITDGKLPQVTTIDSTSFLITSQIKGLLDEDGDLFFSILGVNSTVLDFDIRNIYQTAEEGRNLHIAGGLVKSYDGSTVTEQGFLLYPENIEDGGTATTGGSMEDGTYNYLAVYRWTDNKGNEHLSAPSPIIQVTLSGGTSTQTQDITVPTLRLTEKENVVIDLYRTESNGTIFYKVTTNASPEFNDKTVDSITITDTTVDSDLIDNEILYTTGGELDNIAPGAASIIESFNNRIFLAGLENEDELVYSKINFEGRPVEFNDTLRIQVPELGGAIRAIKTLDDKLIIFKESAMYFISGDGPNNLGQQDTYTEPELLSTDIGCENSDSVVLSPLGLFFKSAKGIYLLDRGLSLRYIGGPVEAFNDLEVTSAVVIGDKNQIRFTTRTGECLVYNYFSQKWSTFTNHKAISAISLNQQYYYIRPDEVIYQEDDSTFTDAGSPIKMRVETDWINFAGVQGFQRVYRCSILGQYKSPHKLRCRVAYNFIDAFTEEKVIDSSEICDDNRYGEYSPYGEPDTVKYGGSGNLYQARVDFSTQKCQSIKIRLEDIQTTELGEGLDLSNISFRVGGKQGLNKPNFGNKFGSS